MPRRNASPAVVTSLAVFLLLTLPALPAEANLFNWWNSSGGSANTPGNWNPASLPGPSDDTYFGQFANAFTVSFASPTNTFRQMYVYRGSPTFNISGTLATAFAPIVYGNVNWTVSGGTLSVPNLWFGYQNTAGNLTLTGRITQLTSTSSASIDIGHAGDASVSVVGGAGFHASGPVSIASVSGTNGSLIVAGVSAFPNLVLSSMSAAGDIAVGDQGTGYLEASNGGGVTTAAKLYIGKHSNGAGTVRLWKASHFSSYIGVSSSTWIGTNDTPGEFGGTGLLSLETGWVDLGSLFLGDPDDPLGYGRRGILRVFDGGTAVASTVGMNTSLTGAIELRGGLLQVAGGFFNDFRQDAAFAVSSPVGSPVLWLDGGLQNRFWPVTGDPVALGIGRGGNGRVRVANYLTGTQIQGDFVMADSTGGIAALEVDSTASATVSGDTRIGTLGSATVAVTGGGTFNAAHAVLGGGPGTQFTVRDAGSAANFSGALDVGGTDLASSNAPTTLLADVGGAIHQTGAAPMRVWDGGGALSIGASALVTSASEVDVAGALSLTGGTLQAPLTRFTGTGYAASFGRIQGRVLLADTTTSLYTGGETPPQTLVVGDSSANDGFVGNGRVVVNQDTLVVLDHDGADFWRLWLNGGVVRLPNGGHLGPNSVMTGSGRLEGSLANDGTITLSPPEGTPNASGPAPPTRARAAAAPERADVVATLDVAGHLTQLAGTTSSGQLHVLAGGALSARGVIGSDVALDGALDLGPAPALLVLGGALQMGSAAFTNLRLGAEASGLQDTIVGAGATTLGGTLALRSLPNNVPAVGDTFTVLMAASCTGTFASVTLNGQPAAGVVAVLVEPTRVRVAIVGAVLAVDPSLAPRATPSALRFAAVGPPRRAALALDLPGAASVRVTAYDVTGRLVAVLEDGPLAAGTHRFALDRPDVPSGVYFARAVVRESSTGRTQALTARVTRLR